MSMDSRHEGMPRVQSADMRRQSQPAPKPANGGGYFNGSFSVPKRYNEMHFGTTKADIQKDVQRRAEEYNRRAQYRKKWKDLTSMKGTAGGKDANWWSSTADLLYG
jgi:hypothetical protein